MITTWKTTIIFSTVNSANIMLNYGDLDTKTALADIPGKYADVQDDRIYTILAPECRGRRGRELKVECDQPR